MNIQFKFLSLGARFSVIEDSRIIYVKLSKDEFIRFDEHVVCYDKQVVNKFIEDVLVSVREPTHCKTYHHYPKTAKQEGYDYYMYHPNRYRDNPYEEGTQAYEDWEEGWDDADWDDCE
jgi:hypothetical protein